MSKSYPNQRDCEHGSMRGKCDICEYEQDIKELRERIVELKAHNLGLTKTLVELEAEIAKLRNGNAVYFDENTLEQAAHD